MGPIWGRQDPCGPHVGPMNLAIWVVSYAQHLGQNYYSNDKNTNIMSIEFFEIHCALTALNAISFFIYGCHTQYCWDYAI